MSLDDPGTRAPDQPEPSSQDARPGRSVLPEVQDVSDARTLRALTHPVRIALIEVLGLGDAMTATQLGEQIGESPTTCSFHLRQLAKYGLVEEAGGGKGRARPWKMTSTGMHISGKDGDPETEVAAAALGRLVSDRQIARYQAWQRTRASYPREWRTAATSTEWMLYLTASELEQLNGEVAAVIDLRLRERLTDPSKRPPGAIPVDYLLFSYPIGVPPAESGGTPERGEPPTA
jgi:DNA-binding transcriptional ArsR family regulator